MNPSQSHTPSVSPAQTLAVVPVDVLDQMRQQIECLVDLLGREAIRAYGPGSDYQEPGPYAKRKFFTPEELMERWGWGKTKVYEIPEIELPYWKKGQLKRYFWAHVWAYEGRITQEQADSLYAVQTSEFEVLPHPPAKFTRLR